MSTPIPPGVTCTLEEWVLSQNVPPNEAQQVQCLAPTDYIGMTVIVASGTCSLVAMTYVLYRIAKRMWLLKRSGSGGMFDVFKHSAAILMFSLFVADILQAIGAVLSIRWIIIKKVEVGGFCTAQGVVQQLGETAVAIATITIAVDTFISVLRNKTIKDKGTVLAIASFSWIPVAMVVIIGNLVPRGHNRQFIAPTPYWCWISRPYLYTWRLGGEYFWLWLALIVSLITNGLLYCWLRGNIAIQYEEITFAQRVVFQSSNRTPRPYTRREVRRRKKAVIMLAYPLVYSITVVPLTVVRWIGFGQEAGGRKSHIQPGATLAVAAIYASSGFLNAILFLTSRSGSTLFSGVQQDEDEDESRDNFGQVNPPGGPGAYFPTPGSAGGSAGPAAGQDIEFTPISGRKSASSEAVNTYP